MKSKVVLGLAASIWFVAGVSVASPSESIVYAINEKGTGKSMGTIDLMDTEKGLALDIQLEGFTLGKHGITVHEHGDCGAKERDGKMVPGLAAGSRFVPSRVRPSAGSTNSALLTLSANRDGKISENVVAQAFTLSEVRGRTLIIYGPGGDARIACGVIR